MNIVAIETATETVGVAVRTGSGAEAAFTLSGRRRHVETLAPAMEHLLAQLGLAPTRPRRGGGRPRPRLFTGLRVGVAAAKGLAQALGSGCWGSPASTSSPGPPHSSATAATCWPPWTPGGVRCSPACGSCGPAPAAAEDVIGAGLFTPRGVGRRVSELGGVPIVGVGDGAQRYAEVLGAVPGVTVRHGRAGLAPAADPVGHGRRALRRGGTPPVDPAAVVPPSTCGRPMPRATSPRSPPPETRPRMDLRIEKLKRRDLRHLLPIEAAVFPEPWSVGVFNSELALRHGRLYRAAWHGDDMAGYIGFMIVDEEAHVTTIATAPSFQRQGVARTLLIDGIHTLFPMGVRHLSLEVAASNEPAQTSTGASGSRRWASARTTTRSPARTRWSCGPTTSTRRSTPSGSRTLDALLTGPATRLVPARLVRGARAATSGSPRRPRPPSAARTPCTRSPRCRPSTRSGRATPRPRSCPPRASSASASSRTARSAAASSPAPLRSVDELAEDDFRRFQPRFLGRQSRRQHRHRRADRRARVRQGLHAGADRAGVGARAGPGPRADSRHQASPLPRGEHRRAGRRAERRRPGDASTSSGTACGDRYADMTPGFKGQQRSWVAAAFSFRTCILWPALAREGAKSGCGSAFAVPVDLRR